MRFAMTIAMTIALVAVPATDAGAQSVFKRIKENAKQKVADRKSETKDRIVQASGEPVDSALAKTVEPVDSIISKSASGVAVAVSRKADGLATAFRDQDSFADEIGAALDAGRVILPDITFQHGTAVLDPASDPALAALGEALGKKAGMFLIEGHVAPDANGDASVRQQLSTTRAMAVKEWLVAAGVDGARLVALGVGATRPPDDGGDPERIEIAAVR